MHRRFLPSGRVRYFPNSEYLGTTASCPGSPGVVERARAAEAGRHDVPRRRHSRDQRPPFEVADGVRCVPAGEIARTTERPERFVIIGAGKTALDACVWLLEQGVPAAAIRWIKPREAWWLNRRFNQPHTLLPDLYRGTAIQLEAMAQATSITISSRASKRRDSAFASIPASRRPCSAAR